MPDISRRTAQHKQIGLGDAINKTEAHTLEGVKLCTHQMNLAYQTTPLLRVDPKRCGSRAKQENVLVQLVHEEIRTPSLRRVELLVGYRK